MGIRPHREATVKYPFRSLSDSGDRLLIRMDIILLIRDDNAIPQELS